MDKTARIILGFAIAIIYPILMFLSVSQLVSKPASLNVEYPSYPNYSECGSQTGFRYESCRQAKEREYDKAQEEYLKTLEERNREQSNYTFRIAAIMLIIALLSIVGVYFLRDIRELTGGIGAGSAIVIAGAAITVAGTGWDSGNKALANALVLFSFCVSTGMLWFVDKNVRNTSRTPITPAAAQFNPNPQNQPLHDKPTVDSRLSSTYTPNQYAVPTSSAEQYHDDSPHQH